MRGALAWRVFVEHVAYALRGKTIGDGTVYLACRQVLSRERHVRPAGVGVGPYAAQQQVGPLVG
jgi:hypothetical protein